jgi:hypothetical protein
MTSKISKQRSRVNLGTNLGFRGGACISHVLGPIHHNIVETIFDGFATKSPGIKAVELPFCECLSCGHWNFGSGKAAFRQTPLLSSVQTAPDA